MKENPGRLAGILYLLLVLLAPYRLLYISNKMIVPGDATATASNIAAHPTMFRLGIVTDLFCGVTLIFLTLALYRLFKATNVTLAVLVVITGGIIPATIDFVNVLNDAAALILVRGPEYLSVFAKPQRDAMALFFLRLHHQVVLAAEILWGLWLFPLALLVHKSRFIPRWIGLWLLINGVAYIVTSLTGFLLPQYENSFANISFPALLGEIAFTLWILIKGVNREQAMAA